MPLDSPRDVFRVCDDRGWVGGAGGCERVERTVSVGGYSSRLKDYSRCLLSFFVVASMVGGWWITAREGSWRVGSDCSPQLAQEHSRVSDSTRYIALVRLS